MCKLPKIIEWSTFEKDTKKFATEIRAAFNGRTHELGNKEAASIIRADRAAVLRWAAGKMKNHKWPISKLLALADEVTNENS